jgi:hypothetical protein
METLRQIATTPIFIGCTFVTYLLISQFYVGTIPKTIAVIVGAAVWIVTCRRWWRPRKK